MINVVVYSTPGCPKCRVLKRTLRKQGTAFISLQVGEEFKPDPSEPEMIHAPQMLAMIAARGYKVAPVVLAWKGGTPEAFFSDGEVVFEFSDFRPDRAKVLAAILTDYKPALAAA